MRRVQSLDAMRADITAPAMRLPDSDVVVASHVLEHLEDPAAFLRAMRERLVFNWAIFEVPLEDLPLCRLKALIRDRSKNPSGHVQFFTAESFERLVRESGFEPSAHRRYVPVPTVASLRRDIARYKLPGWYLPIQWFTRIAGPRLLGPIWSRVGYAHYAVICRGSLS
jgi:hypothetical protein